MIDTERGSGELYAHLGEYDVCTLEAPFTPEKYTEAVRAAESAGYDTIIIDSLSHAWAGPGGVLDIHGQAANKAGNSWAAWRQVIPRHNELVEAILQSKCHVIATMRSKMEHIQTVENGKTMIKKVGMNPVQRDGMEYEFTVFLDLDPNHTAAASKDRTSLFDGQVFKPSRDTGRKLLKWLESGADVPEEKRSGPPQDVPEPLEGYQAAFSEVVSSPPQDMPEPPKGPPPQNSSKNFTPKNTPQNAPQNTPENMPQNAPHQNAPQNAPQRKSSPIKDQPSQNSLPKAGQKGKLATEPATSAQVRLIKEKMRRAGMDPDDEDKKRELARKVGCTGKLTKLHADTMIKELDNYIKGA